ncbi:phosphoribosylformylglycinamidine synthase [Microthyrium microscopicum]|uniref:Phosphoribosylformylglycinamidine synthase n=1 Tax=Microthyrium microscopicum TaxID=703497 RepID=A0A6A6UPC4_9PEZI|nr:phosphoribosylformylglycinamidine synthase [Microthyrium microscopicum]
MTSPSEPYLVLPGSYAFSDFRLARIANALGASSVRALWVHYVNPTGAITSDTLSKLGFLLEYGEQPNQQDRLTLTLLDALNHSAEPKDENVSLFYIVPRPGTISPWSSQATSIAHVCGLGDLVGSIERGMVIAASLDKPLDADSIPNPDTLYDRMTQTISRTAPNLDILFEEHKPAPAKTIPLIGAANPKAVLEAANSELGLALDNSEIEYLLTAYTEQLKRNPVDVELFMFAQVNSEHCRHKQFNASWTIDGLRKASSLFDMIRNTHRRHPQHVVSAYSDNAAVLSGENASHWAPNYATGEWSLTKEVVHYLAKVETHNHPTAVSPYPGAATGSGGEIRDEGAVGRGSRPKAGLSGFTVSDLLIPEFKQPWEMNAGKPAHIASSLDIMLEAPIGSATFNNEFGRPCTTGYFRTLTTEVTLADKSKEIKGYHKPIMIAGGVGTVRPEHALKTKGLVNPGAQLIVIGGPAMLIGLGGGAASSVQSGEGSIDLDFASVQRGNAEVQRRAQEVINTCTSLGAQNPILFIHDVGAGGLSNALPELVHDSDLGAKFELREVDNADKGMSPLQIWCCEAQERYVMAVSEDKLEQFKKICRRERCGYSLVGTATGSSESADNRLILVDRDSRDFPTVIDLPMSTLFGKPPRMTRIVDSKKLALPPFDSSLTQYIPKADSSGVLSEAVNRVLALPTVGSKSFLITIGDRSVGGLTTRDQMVGPWQVPVADVSVTATSLMEGIKTGEAMAMGEKPTLALISPAASARMSVVESLMNIAAAHLSGQLTKIRLSANWMAASSHPGEGAALYEAVEAIGMKLCPELGISIPVGKDSMSMKMKWKDPKSKESREVVSPLSLVITAFAPVSRIDRTWTPALRRPEEVGESLLMFVDLAEARRRMGGSAIAQVFSQIGDDCPDADDALIIKDFFDGLEQLHESDAVLAYHDRSDGGLFTTLAEMAFAGRCGIDIMLDAICPSSSTKDVIEGLFNEELGAVFQIPKNKEREFKSCFATCGPPIGMIKKIGVVLPRTQQTMTFRVGPTVVYQSTRAVLQQRWASTSYHMQKLRDNPACAEEEFYSLLDNNDPGLAYNLTYKPKENILPLTSTITSVFSSKPCVAILREEGVNGQSEMAFAFHSAGFSAIDVHMTDILSGRVSLSSFIGLAACGGFSYADVLGAGQGWAKSVLLHDDARKDFADFFSRKETFALGVCNGCQFLSRLKSIIPGAEGWPTFERNASEQYEARVCMVEVMDGPTAAQTETIINTAPGLQPSVFLHGMNSSSLPIVTAHGEGRASFSSDPTSTHTAQALLDQGLVTMRYVDNYRRPTEKYPFNPNGSPAGIAGVRTPDGRVLAMMPHPERMVLREASSWLPDGVQSEWGEFGAWMRLFRSARRWVG